MKWVHGLQGVVRLWLQLSCRMYGGQLAMSKYCSLRHLADMHQMNHMFPLKTGMPNVAGRVWDLKLPLRTNELQYSPPCEYWSKNQCLKNLPNFHHQNPDWRWRPMKSSGSTWTRMNTQEDTGIHCTFWTNGSKYFLGHHWKKENIWRELDCFQIRNRQFSLPYPVYMQI